MHFLDYWTARPARRLMSWRLTGMVCIVLAGCGDSSPLKGAKLFPVKGKVVLADGKSLTGGQVVFVGEKSMITSNADIQSDGSFSFKKAGSDGLPEGPYKVSLMPPTLASAKGSAAKTKSLAPYDAKYGDEDTTDLRATVTSDESKNIFVFKLDARTSTTGSTGRGGR
jgi:hypothetical protein